MKKEDEENIIDQWLEKCGNPEVSKQVEEELELEEAFERIRQESFICCSLSKFVDYVTVGEREKISFIKGAKWQAKRMYSEEDMRLAFEVGRNFQLTGENNFNEILKNENNTEKI